MQDIITFLRELQANNHREWFMANKDRYATLQARFNGFVDELIHEISRFDETVTGLTAKDCTYRIYRDVRFSADKSPYKTHMGRLSVLEARSPVTRVTTSTSVRGVMDIPMGICWPRAITAVIARCYRCCERILWVAEVTLIVLCAL